MKRALCILMFLVVACAGMSACSESHSQKTDYSVSLPQSDVEDDFTGISQSEAKQLAESALYRQLILSYNNSDIYNVNKTEYSIGSITGSSTSGYTVKGKCFLFDHYGSLKKSKNFTVFVSWDGKATVTEW